MTRVFLSLGSDLGDKLEQLRRAVERLARVEGVRFVAVSRLYESEPWDYEAGQVVDRSCWSLNCVVAIDTRLAPRVLLEEVRAIENALGRGRPEVAPEAARALPQTMDIDILLYGDEVISAPDDLHIPHLFLDQRRFILRPLAEIAPDFEHPVLYRTVRELLDDLDDDHQVHDADFPPDWLLP